jgi:proteic killer suppression protein
MIRTFADKQSALIYAGKISKSLPQTIQKRAYTKMLMIDAAKELNDLLVPPGNKLEALSGNRNGQHSIRINDQWRICFNWHNGDAWNVEIIDYH